MKKNIRLGLMGVVVVLALMVCLGLPISASETLEVAVKADQTAAPGGEVTVAVEMSNNITGFTNFELYVDYDHNDLELLQICDAGESGLFVPGSISAVNLSKDYEGRDCGFITSARADSYEALSGTLFTMTFRVKEDAAAGETAIRLINRKFNQVDENGRDKTIVPNLTDGTITIKEQKPEVEKINLVGANMTLGNDLKINFMVKKADVKDGYVARVTQEGKEPVNLQLWSYNSAYYAASYSVAAKEMTDILSVEIYDADGCLVSNPFTRTIKEYAMTLLNNPGQKTTLKSVVVDMLNYGTEAQKYFKYHEDAYANAEVTAEQQSQYATGDVECVNNQQAVTNFVGANLSLEDSILLNVFFKTAYTDKLTASISFTDYRGGEVTANATLGKYGSMTKVVVDQIVLADAKRPITVTVYDGDTVVGRGVESVESYIARNLTNSDTGAINMAIMKFATSAYNYLGGTN